ncbi:MULTISPECIES: HAMP domain-containing sensor histidine kinase [unclassified Sutcliffiella]|uniref:sensor histidine kinase n=1 Tax=unclassified Sutcliffiella TaxID=2837532 RepID=UPI0030CE298C
MFKKLRNKLLLLNMMMISLVMITAFGAIYIITYTNIQKENQNKLESIPLLSQAALRHAPFQQNNPDSKMVVRIPIEYSQSFALLVDKDGQVKEVLSYLDLPSEVFEEFAEKTWSAGKQDGTINLENRKWQYRISQLGNRKILRFNGNEQINNFNDYYQIKYLDITDSSNTLKELLITFLFVGIAMLFILFGISFYFANRSIRPIEESWDKQKQFVADASHELKTPLAIINANTDALLANGQDTINSQKKWIDYIQSETGRMGKLVNDMLYLAKVEDTYEDQIPLEISNTVLDVIASMEAVLFEKGINLTQTIEPDIVAKGDSERIQQAILILLDNAAKYTNKKGQVDISLKKVKNHAVFSVTNSGEGIPADKMTRIFDRFYRSDPSRSKETGGYGLGLSIAKAIIERSGGIIYVESTKNGTTFTFELKLN